MLVPQKANRYIIKKRKKRKGKKEKKREQEIYNFILHAVTSTTTVLFFFFFSPRGLNITIFFDTQYSAFQEGGVGNFMFGSLGTM